MKARVKATGEIVTARGIYTRTWTPYGMEEIDPYDMNEVEVITDPDYWERLKHQYAGMAMQGMVRTVGHDRMYPPEKMAIFAVACANAFVEKLKEEEK